MPLLVAVLKMLFASSFFRLGFFASGKRLQQQKAAKLLKVQATRSTPPLGPAGQRGGGGTVHNSYGMIGRAMASWDQKAKAAKDEDAQDKSSRYEGLFTTPAARASSAAPSAADLTQHFDSMDKNKDGKIDLQELHDGMKEHGQSNAMALSQFLGSADNNGDGKLDRKEFVSAVQTKVASQERVEKLSARVAHEAFAQDSVDRINSLIVLEREKYTTLAPQYAAFMQKLDRSTGNAFMAIYTQCGTSAKWRGGFHEHCVLEKLEPLIGEEGKQQFSRATSWFSRFSRATFLEVFVQSVFVELERQVQNALEADLSSSVP